MSGHSYYPPPDFGCPVPSSAVIRPATFQCQQPPSSNFQPGMWNWFEQPGTPWGYNGQGSRGGGGGPPVREHHGFSHSRGKLTVVLKVFGSSAGWGRYITQVTRSIIGILNSSNSFPTLVFYRYVHRAGVQSWCKTWSAPRPR